MNINEMMLFLKGFVLDEQFLSLFTSTIVLFTASFVFWYVYSKQLAQRDLFDIPQLSADSKYKNYWNRFIHVLKYLFIFPAFSFIWFLIFAYMLSLMSKSRPIEEIMYFGIIVVASVRIGAYVHESLAEDMAKLLPWSLILIFLIDPQSITLQSIMDSFIEFIDNVSKIAKYLIFIAVVEWLLRIFYWLFKEEGTKAPY